MRVTIGQINTINGDFESNTNAVIRAIKQGRQEKSDLVVLPETCIQGYTSLDWFLDRDVQRCALAPLEKIVEATKGITAIVGTVRPSNEATGRRLFNAAAVIRDQKLLGFADKTLLPEYDVFDDPRYFQPGLERHIFPLPETRLGDNGHELWALVLEAARLDEVVEQVIATLEFSVLAKYAFGLAQSFNAFYNLHPSRSSIFNEERDNVRRWRAAAVIYVRDQLTRALDLMGVGVPQRM